MASGDTAQFEDDPQLQREHWVEEDLARYLRRLQAGDGLALLDCVVLCHEEKYPIPGWARYALAMVAQRYLSGTFATLDDALFGAKKSIGRHSNLATKRRKAAQHQLWFDIASAYKANGLRGDELWDAVLEEVIEYRLPKGVKPPPVPTAETLRKTYQKMKKKGVKPSVQSLLFRNLDEICDTDDEK